MLTASFTAKYMPGASLATVSFFQCMQQHAWQVAFYYGLAYVNYGLQTQRL